MSKTKEYPKSVIVGIDTAIDLVLAATYAMKVCHSAATGDWVKDRTRREMCAMAESQLQKALDAWRKNRQRQ